MKKITLFLIIAFLSNTYIYAQITKDYAVPLNAITNSLEPSITIYWTASSANSFSIYRKLKNENTWTILSVSMPSTTRSYKDTSILVNTIYEYKVVKNATGYNAYGYISSGINMDIIDDRGIMILVVDSTVSTMSGVINNYIKTVEEDAWTVKKIIVGRYEAVSSVKSKIVNLYLEDPTRTKTLFLLGHIPVPYSGNFTTPPDGHTDHIVAWPTDAYYGDMDAIWDDVSVNNTTGSDPRNHNIPGDGKFDYSYPPTEIELEIGRVDFSNLNYFTPITEFVLYQRYLEKDMKYRNAGYSVRNKAIIDDNFGTLSGEAFASSGWKSFAPIINDTNIETADLRASCDTSSFLFSYGCGPGSYENCGGIGSSSDLAGDSLRTVFNMLFGSYFGDWDSPNNLMRSMIAQGATLTTCWSGRPHWYLHHMGMGYHIGYDQKIVQNNTNLYHANIFGNGIQIALLGDPSLRAQIVAPPKNIRATYTKPTITIQWDTIANEGIIGYIIYKKNTTNNYDRITNILSNTNSYEYQCVNKVGIEEFMVKSVKLEETASGTFYNTSIGKSDTAFVNILDSIITNINVTVNTINGNVTLYFTSSIEANTYKWTLGDGTILNDSLINHTYSQSGNYNIKLIISDGCITDTIYQNLNLVIDNIISNNKEDIVVYPNPSNELININNDKIKLIEILDLNGNKLIVSNNSTTDISNLSAGVYFINIYLYDGVIVQKKLFKY
jgi:hypothetical protein